MAPPGQNERERWRWRIFAVAAQRARRSTRMCSAVWSAGTGTEQAWGVGSAGVCPDQLQSPAHLLVEAGERTDADSRSIVRADRFGYFSKLRIKLRDITRLYSPANYAIACSLAVFWCHFKRFFSIRGEKRTQPPAEKTYTHLEHEPLCTVSPREAPTGLVWRYVHDHDALSVARSSFMACNWDPGAQRNRFRRRFLHTYADACCCQSSRSICNRGHFHGRALPSYRDVNIAANLTMPRARAIHVYGASPDPGAWHGQQLRTTVFATLFGSSRIVCCLPIGFCFFQSLQLQPCMCCLTAEKALMITQYEPSHEASFLAISGEKGWA
jgi:hypothetical protein